LASLEAIRAYIEEAIKYNDFSTGDLNQYLFREIVKTKKLIEKAEKDVLGAKVTQEIEAIAQEYGAMDPGLTAAYIERQNIVKAGNIDDKGNVIGIIVESKDGIWGEGLVEHIKRLRIGANTACLFTVNQHSQNTKKPLINPWKKETFNLTMQGKIIRENPDMANRFKAEAGV
jgi:hypothetical protein